LQQPGSDVFIYIGLPTTGTNASGNIIDYQSHFAALKANRRESVNGLSLPADKADHEIKPINHEVHEGTQAFLSFSSVILSDNSFSLW